MGFAKDLTPRAFTKDAVLAIKPGQNGVYGIYKANSWIYVGKGDIRDRMLAHINGDNPCITKNGATHWVAEVTSRMDAREKELIRELDPTCNKKVG